MRTIFDDLDAATGKDDTNTIVHAPFGYAGGKRRSVHKIIPYLPYLEVYVEPFGGSAAVLLNRKSSKLEVFNDRYAGVVAFFRCMREEALTHKLMQWVENTIHSKEDFVHCRETWADVHDPVERAGRWLYMISYSFSGVGRHFGRAKKASGAMSGKLAERIPEIWEVHQRFKYVQVENQDYAACIEYYDSPETVLYLDPPYIESDAGCYRHTLTPADHQHLLDQVFRCKGFVALSGYSHPMYEKCPWDDRIEWDALVTAKSQEKTLTAGRQYAKEVLWIKDVT